MSGRVLAAALIIALGTVAWDDAQHQSQFPPRPHRLVGVALIYTVLAVLAIPAPALAAAFAVAIDIALLLKPSLGAGVGLGTGQGVALGGSQAVQVPVMAGASTVAV
jgi:hypothetical protein